MGGGSGWRSLAKLAGSVAPSVRVSTPAVNGSANSACSYCRVNSSSRAAASSQVRFVSCSCTAESATINTTPNGARSLWEPDEWELAEEEERVDRLVFGSMPSQAEIREASSDLHKALTLGLMAPSGSFSASAVSSTSTPASSESTTEHGGDVSASPVGIQQLACDWIEPPPIVVSQGLVPGGQSNVAEALYMFQHSPQVQGIVESLANDPAIWGAVLANEKIQEFKRKLEGDSNFFATNYSRDTENENHSHGDYADFFSRKFWQNKMSQFMDLLNSIINGLFKAAGTKFFGEDRNAFETTVKACTMLALVVLSMVIFKRAGHRAA